MKKTISTLALLSFSALTTGQALLPACALPCIFDAVRTSTTCEVADLLCVCTQSNFELVQANSATCVINKCSGPEKAIAALEAARTFCLNALKAEFSSRQTSDASAAASFSAFGNRTHTLSTTSGSPIEGEPATFAPYPTDTAAFSLYPVEPGPFSGHPSAAPTATATSPAAVITRTIVRCDCGDKATAVSYLTAAPIPTAAKNGTAIATTSASRVQFSGEATLATISLGAGLAWLAFLVVVVGV